MAAVGCYKTLHQNAIEYDQELPQTQSTDQPLTSRRMWHLVRELVARILVREMSHDM